MAARLFLCRFSDAGNRGSIDRRGRPASEKRQGRCYGAAARILHPSALM